MTCTLGGTNTYTGNTIVTGGTLAVGIGGVGAISNSPSISVGTGAKLQLNAGALLGSTVNISLAAGGYFDVNGLGAGTTYTLGSGATLNAAGTGTASGTTQAEIHGNATGTVSLGSRPISLTFTPTAFTGRHHASAARHFPGLAATERQHHHHQQRRRDSLGGRHLSFDPGRQRNLRHHQRHAQRDSLHHRKGSCRTIPRPPFPSVPAM